MTWCRRGLGDVTNTDVIQVTEDDAAVGDTPQRAILSYYLQEIAAMAADVEDCLIDGVTPASTPAVQKRPVSAVLYLRCDVTVNTHTTTQPHITLQHSP